MKNKSVAILDIRSKEVTFLLGSKGVNDTFVFSGNHTETYEGYSVEGFIDEESFRRAVLAAITSVRQNYEGIIDELYVGLPSCFISVQTKGHTISFPSKRKISAQDVDALFESGLNDLMQAGHCIRKSGMYFTLGDNRRYFQTKDLYGVPTTMLKGALCYYFVSEAFYDGMMKLFASFGFENVQFIPSTLAQATYLLPQKRREGYAFLLDVGFLTTSISVIYGNGIVHEESFNCGVGTILVSLMEEFGVDYAQAEEILAAANISGGSFPKDMQFALESGEKQFSVQAINDVIKVGLDVTCERVDNFFARYYKDKKTAGLLVNPISVTGEGVNEIKGLAEHVSKRLNRLTEIVFPELPFYGKPSFSSRIGLLNAALTNKEKVGWIARLFGGKRK